MRKLESTTALLTVAFLAIGHGAFFAAAAPLSAQEADGSGFRTEAEGSWYHPVEPAEWSALGGDAAAIDAVLKRIAFASGERSDPAQPDTIVAFGPGHWAFEWTREGDAAMARAFDAQKDASRLAALKEASLYYTLASSPHTDDPQQRSASKKASDAYILAGSLIPETVERVEISHAGASFGANLHLPVGAGPFPALVISKGSDSSKEMLWSYFQEMLAPRGIAMLSLDTPGLGDSAAFDARDGQTDKLHLAAIEWVKKHAAIDAEAIFMQGISFTGNSAARVFLKSDELGLAGVIHACGPLTRPFLAPPEAYAELPAFTIDGVKARLGLPPEASLEELAESLRPLALFPAGPPTGPKIETPLMVITTTRDPVAPLQDLDELSQRAGNLTSIVLDEPGHCPESDVEDILAVSWIVEQLRHMGKASPVSGAHEDDS